MWSLALAKKTRNKSTGSSNLSFFISSKFTNILVCAANNYTVNRPNLGFCWANILLTLSVDVQHRLHVNICDRHFHAIVRHTDQLLNHICLTFFFGFDLLFSRIYSVWSFETLCLSQADFCSTAVFVWFLHFARSTIRAIPFEWNISRSKTHHRFAAFHSITLAGRSSDFN